MNVGFDIIRRCTWKFVSFVERISYRAVDVWGAWRGMSTGYVDDIDTCDGQDTWGPSCLPIISITRK